MTEKNVLTLSKPVTHGTDTITKLTFREPTGDDIMKFGYPVVLENKGTKAVKIAVDTEVAGNMAAQLANVPPSVIRGLPLADFNAVVGMIAGFFMESLVALFSTVTST